MLEDVGVTHRSLHQRLGMEGVARKQLPNNFSSDRLGQLFMVEYQGFAGWAVSQRQRAEY